MAGRTQTYYNNNPEAKSKKARYDKKYNAQSEQRKNRSSRNMARRALASLGLVKKGDGKDVDHKDGNPTNNSRTNLGVLNKSKNRAKK